MKSIILRIIFLCVLFASFDVLSKSNVKFHGQLNNMSCMINNNEPVNIAFGNVGINKIDGAKYTQPVPVELICDDSYSGIVLLSIKGVVSDFDNSAIQTDVSDLGIRIMNDGKPIPLDEAIACSVSSLPKLTAVPVAKPGGALNEGVFHGVATLVAEIE